MLIYIINNHRIIKLINSCYYIIDYSTKICML